MPPALYAFVHQRRDAREDDGETAEQVPGVALTGRGIRRIRRGGCRHRGQAAGGHRIREFVLDRVPVC
jgi:hypothetical protein